LSASSYLQSLAVAVIFKATEGQDHEGLTQARKNMEALRDDAIAAVAMLRTAEESALNPSLFPSASTH
jgi:hypothetical protein